MRRKLLYSTTMNNNGVKLIFYFSRSTSKKRYSHECTVNLRFYTTYGQSSALDVQGCRSRYKFHGNYGVTKEAISTGNYSPAARIIREKYQLEDY